MRQPGRPVSQLILQFLCCSAVVITVSLSSNSEAKPPTKAAPGRAKQFSGWQLKQESYSAGTYEVRICKEAIRAQNSRTGFAVISQAPTWKTFYVNDASKAYCPVDADKLSHGLNRAAALFGAPVFTDMPMVLISSTKTGDMPEELYGSPPGFAKKQLLAIEKKQVTTNAAIEIHYRVWKSDYPRIECQILSRLYALPLVDGIPLDFRSENQNNHTHRDLATAHAVQSAFSPTIFTVPKSYRLVKSVEELQPKEQAEGIDLVLGEISNPNGENAKKARGKESRTAKPK